MSINVPYEHEGRFVPTPYIYAIKALLDRIEVENQALGAAKSFTVTWLLEHGVLKVIVDSSRTEVMCETRFRYKSGLIETHTFTLNGATDA